MSHGNTVQDYDSNITKGLCQKLQIMTRVYVPYLIGMHIYGKSKCERAKCICNEFVKIHITGDDRLMADGYNED